MTADVGPYLIKGYFYLPQNKFGEFADRVILQHDNISKWDVDVYEDNKSNVIVCVL